MADNGWSGTPLLRKLGYRDGQRALLVGLPAEPAEAALSGLRVRLDPAGMKLVIPRALRGGM